MVEKVYNATVPTGITKRGRVTAEADVGTPAAATFQAQNVPFIGAQRRESEASNFERLASSLGQFSSALGGFASAYESHEKKMAKEAEKAAKEAARVAKMSGGERRAERTRTGRDRNTDLLKDNAEFNKLVLPEKIKEENEEFAELERGGWLMEAGTVEVDPETGQEGEWAKIPITPDILIQQNEQEVAKIEQELARPEDAAKRKLAIKYTFDRTARKIKALGEYREKKNFADYFDIMTHSAGGTIKQAKAIHGDDNDAVAQTFIDNAVRIGTEAGIELNNKTFFTKVMPDLIKTITPEIEKDPELAAAFVGMLEGRFGPAKTTMLDHKRTMTGAKGALSAAKRALGKQEYDNRVGALTKEVMDHLDKGGNIEAFTIPDIKVEAPNKDFALNKVKFKQGLAAEMDAKILTVDGSVPKYSSEEKLTALVLQSKQTGLDSPAIKGLMEDVGYKEGETDPSRLVSVLSAYDALALHNPPALKKYFTNRPQDLSFLETTSAILETRPDLDVNAAAKMAHDATQSEGLKGFVKDNLKRVKGLDGITAREGEEIVRTAYAIAYMTGEMDEEEVNSTIADLVVKKQARKPLVHGSRIDLPSNEDPDAGAKKLTRWMSHVGSKIGKDPTKLSVKLSPNTGAYFVIDKETNAPATDPKGNMVTFSYDQVDTFVKADQAETLRLKAEEQNRKKKNREDYKKNMNPVDWEKSKLWKPTP